MSEKDIDYEALYLVQFIMEEWEAWRWEYEVAHYTMSTVRAER